MYTKKKKIVILGCYELDCGGESIAIESLFKEFKLHSNVKVKLVGSEKLTSKGSLAYFFWLGKNLTFWSSVIIHNRRVDWISTPFFTAGFAASMLKPFFGYKICFNHQGSRVPTKKVVTDPLRKAVHFVKYKLIKWMHDVFLSRVDLVLVLSKYSNRTLTSDFPFLGDKRVRVIHNGVDFKNFRPTTSKERALLRKKYQLTDKQVLLYAGRVNATKRVKKLFEVLIEIRKTLPNVVLIIAHTPISSEEENNYKKSLTKFARLNKLDNNLRWYVGKTNIFELYNLSDLTVLLSKEDNFPLVMLESLACKTLFASTPNGAMKEVLEKIDQRLIIKETSLNKIALRLENILKLPETRKKALTGKGYKLVREFSWKRASDLALGYFKEH